MIYQGNSRELEGTQGSSGEALIEVIEGKKTQEMMQRGKISQKLEQKRKYRSALRALKNML